MDPVLWILDESIIGRLTFSQRSLPDILRDHGYDFFLAKSDNQLDFEIPDLGHRPVVLYGSHRFVRSVNKTARFGPGALGVNERTQATQYLSHLNIDWFLNRDCEFMTWQMLKNRLPGFFYKYATDTLFIRPNSGFKTFAGQTIKWSTWDHDISSLDQLSSVVPDTLILVANTQELQGEFRFVIADGKVIAGSEYRWDGKLDIRRDWPQECWDLADQVAKHPWQVDIAYTCDVALTNSGPKIVELNGFSCAGLYACDLNLVVKGVSDAALKDWNESYSDA